MAGTKGSKSGPPMVGQTLRQGPGPSSKSPSNLHLSEDSSSSCLTALAIRNPRRQYQIMLAMSSPKHRSQQSSGFRQGRKKVVPLRLCPVHLLRWAGHGNFKNFPEILDPAPLSQS